MIEGSISFRSLQADVTSVNARYDKQALAYQSGAKPKSPTLFNTQERQIVDDVNISSEAVKQLEDLRALNNHLQRYLDYLKGENEEDQRVRIKPADGRSEAIAARATSFEANITAGTIVEESLDIDFTLDDNGNLTELTVTASKTTTEFVSAEFTLSDTQFFAIRG